MIRSAEYEICCSFPAAAAAAGGALEDLALDERPASCGATVEVVGMAAESDMLEVPDNRWSKT